MIINKDIDTLLKCIKKFSLETYRHQKRVKELTLKILLHINSQGKHIFSSDEIEQICIGALLHDIGKIRVKNFVLTKNGSLTDDEKSNMNQHALKAAELYKEYCRQNPSEIVYNICRYHHERIDGSGYEKIRNIPIYVQVVSIADVWDALTTDRSYRSALSPEEAKAIIMEGKCGAFSDEIKNYIFSVV